MDLKTEVIERALASDIGHRCLGTVTKDLLKPYTVDQVRVVLRAEGRCEYCGADLLGSPEAWHASQWEHMIPRTLGGDDGWGNIALACRSCNSIKRGVLPDGYSADSLGELSREQRVRVIGDWLKSLREQYGIEAEYRAFLELVEQVKADDGGGVLG